MKNQLNIFVNTLLMCLAVLSGPCWAGAEKTSTAGVYGELKKWHRVTVAFQGPLVSETDTNNPFANYRLDVIFTHKATGKTYGVPGYFAADGNAGETGATTGKIWRVHFIPDAIGEWTYKANFYGGVDVAIQSNLTNFTKLPIVKDTGTFIIDASDKKSPDLRAHGMLRYVGKHYLQFAETKKFYLKGGADSPENFLAYFQFDNTYDTGGKTTSGLTNGLHQYQPHVQHWQSGNPVWHGSKGKGIIGVLNYLSSQGVNSVYFLTYNTDGGDGRDTWVWRTPTEKDRFDVSKLDQWEIIFSHMDAKGIQLHLVTQETENDQGLGALSRLRKLYYRELVARFSHHPAIMWNLGEENSNTDDEKKAFAAYIRSVDPYNHPITVHTFNDAAGSYYDNLFGNANFEATSIQGSGGSFNRWARELRKDSAAAGRKWSIFGDEPVPSIDSSMSNLDSMRTKPLWGNLMGGGSGVEWYFSWGDLSTENLSVAQPLWQQTKIALNFFQTYLPFSEMEPDNALTTHSSDYVLAKKGESYAIYLPDGLTTDLNLSGTSGQFEIKWYNPRSGGGLLAGSKTSVTGGGAVNIGQPPSSSGTVKDWAVLLRKTNTTTPQPSPTNPLAITKFVLINSNTDLPIREIGNGAVVDLSQDGKNLAIRADVSGNVQSVKFFLDNVAVRIENVAPYALWGDTSGDYSSGVLAPKSYKIQAIPYPEKNAQGIEGEDLVITIQVVE